MLAPAFPSNTPRLDRGIDPCSSWGFRSTKEYNGVERMLHRVRFMSEGINIKQCGGWGFGLNCVGLSAWRRTIAPIKIQAEQNNSAAFDASMRLDLNRARHSRRSSRRGSPSGSAATAVLPG